MASQLKNATRAGYTILELLVAIGVVGLLMALLLPAVQAAREAARRTHCVNQVRQIILAHEMYHETFGRFPSAWASAWHDIMSATAPPQLRCPSYASSDPEVEAQTVYAQNGLLVAENSSKITDGTSNTVLHGELAFGQLWHGSPLLSAVRCESGHPSGAVYGLADGSVRLLSASLSQAIRNALLEPADGNVVSDF
ncbi:MAG: DUF1559 domain-containing protein [Planctomycetota bacterium]